MRALARVHTHARTVEREKITVDENLFSLKIGRPTSSNRINDGDDAGINEEGEMEE